jgi:putative ABC transport system permease protein
MTWQDLRIAFRSLFRAPGLALSGIVTLGLAVGMATAIFSVVNAVLLRPLPYKDAGSLAVIWASFQNETRGPVSFDDFEDWRRGSATLENAAAYTSFSHPILTGSGSAERLSSLLVTHAYFDVMKVTPKLGRFFLPEEDRDGHDAVVVLSYDFWRAHFGAAPGVIGRSIWLNSRPYTIVGVAGPDLRPLPRSLAGGAPEIYQPVGEPFGPGSRDGRHLQTIVRLRPGVSVEQAQAELNVRCRQMEREHPDVDTHLHANIVRLRDDITRNVRAPLWSLQTAVLLLMLMACANVANLLLAKSSARRREMAIRKALGAGTARLARMLLTESLVLGVLGGACGVLLALWCTAGMTAIAAGALPDAGVLSIDGRVLAFSLALSVAASLLFGIAPILRIGSGPVEDGLKLGTRIAGDRRNRLRQSLAALQIALSLVLLIATGLFGKSFLRLRDVNPGFDPQDVLAASVSLPSAKYRAEAATIRGVDRILANLAAIPGVRDAAVVSVVPMSGDFDTTAFRILGSPLRFDEMASPDRYIVSPDFFRTLRIPLRAGRVFNPRDDADHTPVCVINETGAHLWFQGASPIGRKIRAGDQSLNFDASPFREVVGVVGDVAQYGIGLAPTPQIYMPHAQFPARFLTLLVRASGDPAALARPVRKAVFAADTEQPVYDVEPLEEIVSSTMTARRLGLWLLVTFGLGALLLAVVGIYGVTSYSVASRTSEFGIRVALGARPADVFEHAIGDSLRIAIAGLAVGVAASLAISKLLAGFLFGVSATDAVTYVVLTLFLALVAVASCSVPARRATKVDPVTALRFE